MSTRTRHEVTLPDGRVAGRPAGQRASGCALVARDGTVWYLIAFCSSQEEALARRSRERRTDAWIDHRRRYRILPTREVPALTDRQRWCLAQLGEEPREVHGGDVTYASLARRGLVGRTSLGEGWWRVRRTREGRRALGIPDPAPPLGVSAGPMGGPGAGPVRNYPRGDA
jgi:ribosomal protein L24E